jgi:hypothetical protein
VDQEEKVKHINKYGIISIILYILIYKYINNIVLCVYN